MKERPLRERLQEKLIVDGNGCWIFTGSKKPNGYGQIGQGEGTALPEYAHRVAWYLEYGPIPDGLQVCHRCNVPACCNPKHLYLGTPQDNANDRMKDRMSVDGFDDYEPSEPTKPTLANSEFGRKFPPMED